MTPPDKTIAPRGARQTITKAERARIAREHAVAEAMYERHSVKFPERLATPTPTPTPTPVATGSPPVKPKRAAALRIARELAEQIRPRPAVVELAAAEDRAWRHCVALSHATGLVVTGGRLRGEPFPTPSDDTTSALRALVALEARASAIHRSLRHQLDNAGPFRPGEVPERIVDWRAAAARTEDGRERDLDAVMIDAYIMTLKDEHGLPWPWIAQCLREILKVEKPTSKKPGTNVGPWTKSDVSSRYKEIVSRAARFTEFVNG